MVKNSNPLNFQNMILKLHEYWADKGCVILQPYDMPVGAGTFHWATAMRSLGKNSWKSAYVQSCRRPKDGRYGDNPNRLQQYYQYQVLLKPSPDDSQDLYLGSLKALGIDITRHDIRFVEDDWENPTLGALGVGWEVSCNGLEISQFTYFQQICGIDCRPTSTEITYGLERLALYVQGKDSIYDLQYNNNYTYGDIYKSFEYQYSQYNFNYVDNDGLLRRFNEFETECYTLTSLEESLPLPAYDLYLQACYTFNLLDSRKAISITEREDFIDRLRDMVCVCGRVFIESEEELNQ